MENKNQIPNVFMWMFWRDSKNVYLNPQNKVIPVNQISDSIIKIYIFFKIYRSADNSCSKQKTLEVKLVFIAY